jgi:hypothetical protein
MLLLINIIKVNLNNTINTFKKYFILLILKKILNKLRIIKKILSKTLIN